MYSDDGDPMGGVAAPGWDFEGSGADPAALAETERRLVAALTQSGRYRVVSRLERRSHYHLPAGTSVLRGLYVDIETTGLDESDPIIQLAAVPFGFARDGRIFDVGGCEAWYEDPGVPIPEDVARLTGIRDEDVRGERIDDARVEALAADAALVIAHNAQFDRPRIERRLPAFAAKRWACSCHDVPWLEEGLQGAKLEWLAYKCGMFYEAHRADADCLMGIHLLATSLPSGRLALDALLETARGRTARVWAVRSDRRTKDSLRRRGYRWNGDDDGRPVAWWRDVPEAQLDAESAWLAERVYGGSPRHLVQLFDARHRHSARVAELPYVEWGQYEQRVCRD